MAEVPAFVPLFKESERSLSLVVTELDNSDESKQQPLTAGGVKMNKDSSRSFI